MMKTRPARLRVGHDGFIHVRRPGKDYTKGNANAVCVIMQCR